MGNKNAKPPSSEQKELGFTISGEYPDVCYIPFRTDSDEQWKLTIECLEMPHDLSWVTILLYNDYWDKGTNHKCDVMNIAMLTPNLIELEKIGVDPEIQEKYPLNEIYNTTVYTGIYGGTTAKSFTVFIPFPGGGMSPYSGKGKFHIKLERIE